MYLKAAPQRRRKTADDGTEPAKNTEKPASKRTAKKADAAEAAPEKKRKVTVKKHVSGEGERPAAVRRKAAAKDK